MTDTATAVRPIETSATSIDTALINGWGVDANTENDPTYSYRDRTKDDHSGQWKRPTQQRSDVEILQSIEHKQRPAVFGTSTPPHWLSGMLRRLAFRKSKSNWGHWLLLMGADRINVVEGLVEDLARGRIPNIPAEMGAGAAWKHNKKGVLTMAAIATGVVAGITLLVRSRSESSEESDQS